jgi:hypothetical protein
MSQWTHVCGAIRIDGLEFLGKNIAVELSNNFGNTVSFDDPEEDWDFCNVPCGSEGSIQYDIQHTGDDNSISWGVVYIWGDLRDYCNNEAIYQWIRKACESKSYFIRSCCVKIDIEGNDSYIVLDENEQIIMQTLG